MQGMCLNDCFSQKIVNSLEPHLTTILQIVSSQPNPRIYSQIACEVNIVILKQGPQQTSMNLLQTCLRICKNRSMYLTRIRSDI